MTQIAFRRISPLPGASMSTTTPTVSLPKPIKVENIESEVENILEREMNTRMELERECDSLRKELDVLAKTHSYSQLEKCSLEEKLERTQRRCEELSVKKLESDKAAQLYKSRLDCLEARMLKVEAALAKASTNRNSIGGRNLAYLGRKPADVSPVAETKGSVQDSDGEWPEITGASYQVLRRVSCHCSLKIIDVIKTNLHKENLEIFEQMCFGNLLKIKEFICQGQLLKLLLLHTDMKASNEEKLVFNVNNSNMEFGPREFSLITGLRFGKLNSIKSSSSIHGDIFRGRPRIVLQDIEEAFLKVSRDHGGRGELTLKLALLYFLYGILLAADYKKKIDVQYLHLVDDLQKFDAFPWGRVAYEFLVSSVLSLRTRMDDPKVMRFNICGFSFAFQVWVYEAMPSLATLCAAPANNFENLTTRILHWSATKRIHFDNLKIFFTLGDEVLESARASPEQKNVKVEQQERSTSTYIDSVHQPTQDSSYVPRNESPEIENEAAVKEATPTRHSSFGPNPISMNKFHSPLSETERARALIALAFDNPALDKAQLLWKACSDFEISEAEYERSKELYEMLLGQTKRLKLWISYAKFEAFATIKESAGLPYKRKCIERARGVFERGLSYFRSCAPKLKDERAMLLEEWFDMESRFGDVKYVRAKLPQKLKKRRHVETENGAARYEEYIDYLFPEEKRC